MFCFTGITDKKYSNYNEVPAKEYLYEESLQKYQIGSDPAEILFYCGVSARSSAYLQEKNSR